MNSILFFSNGHGEDAIAVKLFEEFFQEGLFSEYFALPLVGQGNAYRQQSPITLIGPQQEMPSGGFVKTWGGLSGDLRKGLLRLHFQQIRNARKLDFDAIFVVGDVFILLLAGLFLKCKHLYFVSTAKSDTFDPHLALERWIMKHFAKYTYTRDAITGANLIMHGVNAGYKGNIMMDGLTDCIRTSSKVSAEITIGILPGSRAEAYENMIIIIEVLRHLPDHYKVVLAVPSSLNPELFALDEVFQPTQIVSFEELLKQATLVIGLAGTANEQCIGCGVPLFTFPATGPQTTRRRFLDQQRLLCNLPVFIDSRDSAIIAKTIAKYLNTLAVLAARTVKIGPKVMGDAGASKAIVSHFRKNSLCI